MQYCHTLLSPNIALSKRRRYNEGLLYLKYLLLLHIDFQMYDLLILINIKKIFELKKKKPNMYM